MSSAIEKLAAAIRQIREETSLSRRAFGERLKVTEEAIRLYENGQRTPSKAVLQRIVEIGRIPRATALTLFHLRERMPNYPELDEETRYQVAQRLVSIVELFLKESEVLLIEPAKKDLHGRLAGVLQEEFDAIPALHAQRPRKGVPQQQPAHPQETPERRCRQASPHLRRG